MSTIFQRLQIQLFVILTSLLFTSCQKRPSYTESYIIKKNGLYGLIDSTGKEIVAPRFLSITPIRKDGVALAIIDTIYTSFRDSSSIGIRNIPVLNIKYGYITSEDKFLFPQPSYSKIKIDGLIDTIQAYTWFYQQSSFYGGLAVVQDTTTFLYGYIGMNGDTIIPAKYRKANQFYEGRAAVQLDYNVDNNHRGKWGLINPQGENVCDFVFSDLETPFNGRAIARILLVEKTESDSVEIGGEIIEDNNDNIYFEKSISPRYTSKKCVVDENGNIINDNLSVMYTYSSFSKDKISVAIPNRIGELLGLGYRFINKDGEFISPLDINEITEQRAKEIIESKHFLNELLPYDIKFSNATWFEEGYAAVNLGKAWGYIDSMLIPRGNSKYPVFENALPFHHGLAGVKLNGKFGYINKDFDIVIPFKYDSCAIAGKNLCRVYGGKKSDTGYSIISYINRDGKVVWQNVDGFYWKIDDENNYRGWRDFEYDYIGKNYAPVLICICIFATIVIIFVLSKHYKKRLFHKKDDNTAKIRAKESISQTETFNATFQGNTIASEKSLQIESNKQNPQMQNMQKDSKPSIDDRLNNLLNL